MMLSVLTGFFLAYGDAHWGWWILFWIAFFSNTIVHMLTMMAISNKK